MKVDMHNVGKFEASVSKNAWNPEEKDGWFTLKAGILEYSWDGTDKGYQNEEEMTFFCPDVEARIIELKNVLDKALVLAREVQKEKAAENDAWRKENAKKEAEA
jgi:hypothetical protein